MMTNPKDNNILWYCLKDKTDENIIISVFYNNQTKEQIKRVGKKSDIGPWTDDLMKLSWETAKLPDIEFTQEDGTKKIFTGDELLNNIIIQ